MSLLIICLLVSSIANGVEIRISSDSLKVINNWDKTERYLLGLFNRWAGSIPVHKNYALLTELNEKYGVNMLAYNKNLGKGILPKTTSAAKSCCSSTENLKKYAQSDAACEVFGKGSMWNDEYLKEKTSIETYLYGHDTCYSGQYPTISHCSGASNDHGWGVPNNNADGWWNWMFIGNIGCALKNDPNLKYWHIWNEPNAVYREKGKTGEDYAQFYFTVAKGIKAVYSKVKLAGPATWCPPVHKNTFHEWFKPLMDKVVSKGRRDLLDYIDFHAYTNADIYNPLARWDFVVSSIHAVGLYWNGITNGAGFKRSQMTETNVALKENEVSDPNIYWKKRVIENAKQIMALSHNTDKFLLRIQFAIGDAEYYNEEKGNHYGWYQYNDKYMHDVIKPIQEGYPVYFQFTDGVKESYPSYDDGNGIMAQTVYHDDDNTITVLLINYATKDISIVLNDKDGKIIWDTTGRFTRRWGPNTLSVSKSGSKASLTCKLQSITAVTGKYRSFPSAKMIEYEFGPLDESVIMKSVGYKTYDVDETINIWLNKKADLVKAQYAYIKFGLGFGAIDDFKWTIKVKIGSTTYLTKNNFSPAMNYSELPITSSSFLNKISTGTTVKIQFTGTRTNYPGAYWKAAPLSGRISFASLVVGGSESTSSYIKITNGVNLNRMYYAVKLSAIPKGISIKWIKMRSASQTAWQSGVYNKNNKHYEWKNNGPYTAPFDFQVKSTDGQLIYSWDIIDSLNDKDTGIMTQRFGTGVGYTEDNGTGIGSGITVAESIVIVIAVLAVIGLCVYCIWRRRKMKNAVSFDNDNQDIIEDGDSDENATKGGYDMSPIETQTKEEEEEEEVEEEEEEVIAVDNI